jgi:hypothetical protein
MIDPVLLTAADFKDYRDISANIDFETRLKPWILEAQKQELRGFLGDKLYLALINDWDPNNGVFQDVRFIALWQGLDLSERRFYGAKPMLIYFSYARFLTNQSQVVTRYGVKNLERDQSQDQNPIATRTKLGEAQNMALAAQAEVEQYLEDAQTTYPEYEPRSTQPNSKNIYHPVRPGSYRRV